MTKEPWAIIPKFTQQVPVQAALFKDGLFLPILYDSKLKCKGAGDSL